MVRMKSLVCSLMALGFAVSMAGRAHGRNVELPVPIVDAMAATDVSKRPNGVVKFFFGTEKSPAILMNLCSSLGALRADAAGSSDKRARHEAFLWTLVDLEKRAQRAGANSVVNTVSDYWENEMANTTEFEC